MNDLNALLERAAGPVAGPVDVHADLSRAQHALSRTRRRRRALGLAGVATVGVVGVGAVRLTDSGDVARDQATHRTHQQGGGVALLAQPFSAGPYTFDETPQGWEVQGANADEVTIAPIGFPDQEPLSFEGKLVIMFDGNPQSGERVDHGGRTFYVADSDGGYVSMSTQTRPGEPRGVVRVQYPADSGWTRGTMIEFLDSVHVGPDARKGKG